MVIVFDAVAGPPHVRSRESDSAEPVVTVTAEVIDASAVTVVVAALRHVIRSQPTHVVEVMNSTSASNRTASPDRLPPRGGGVVPVTNEVISVPPVPPHRRSAVADGVPVVVLTWPCAVSRYLAPAAASLAGTDSDPREAIAVELATVTADVAARCDCCTVPARPAPVTNPSVP